MPHVMQHSLMDRGISWTLPSWTVLRLHWNIPSLQLHPKMLLQGINPPGWSDILWEWNDEIWGIWCLHDPSVLVDAVERSLWKKQHLPVSRRVDQWFATHIDQRSIQSIWWYGLTSYFWLVLCESWCITHLGLSRFEVIPYHALC